MDYHLWVEISFDAGHLWLSEDPESSCHRPGHGHRYRIRAQADGRLTVPLADKINLLRREMRRLRAELDGTVLDTMLPGVQSTPEGIAAWVLERLSDLSDSVTVSDSEDASVTISRTARRM